MAPDASAAAAVQRVRVALAAASRRWLRDDAQPSVAIDVCRTLAALCRLLAGDTARKRGLDQLERAARASGAAAALWVAASVAESTRSALAAEAWRTLDETLEPQDLLGLADALPDLRQEAVAEAVRRAGQDPMRTWPELRGVSPQLAPAALPAARALPEPSRSRALDAILPALEEPERRALADERAHEALQALTSEPHSRSPWTTLATAASSVSPETARRVLDDLLRLDLPGSEPALHRYAARMRALGLDDDPRVAGSAALGPLRHEPGTYLRRVVSGKGPSRLRYVQDHAPALLAAHGSEALLEAIRTLPPRFRCPGLIRVVPLLGEPDAHAAAAEAAHLLASRDDPPEALLFALAASGQRLDHRDAMPLLSRCTAHLAGAPDVRELLVSPEGRSVTALAPLLSVWGDEALLGVIDALLETIGPRVRRGAPP
ncbi:MAG: hypothetical protein WKG00_34955 [Polyangiaceae bacterium]